MPPLLFLAHRIPYPPDRGEKIRAWHILRHLAQRYDVYLGCFSVDGEATPEHIAALHAICADVLCLPLDRRRAKLRALLHARPGRPLMLDYYGNRTLQAWVARVLAEHPVKLAFIYSAAMAPYVLGKTNIRLVLDMVDVDSEKWREYASKASWPMRAVWAREARTLLAYERQAALTAERTILVSEPECQRLRELAPETSGRLAAIENGVDLDRFRPGLALASPYTRPGPHIAFTGNMDYWPNADAVAWFAQEVFPAVRQALPGAEFYIVGADPTSEVRRLAELPGVQVTGRVPDVRPYVAHAAVIVAPLRIARGIQNKVMEGMAMGRPVIATPQAFAGIRAAPGKDLLLADAPGLFANHVLSVLRGEHPGLGTAGRRAMEQGHTWDASLRRLDALLAR
ncbi:MAG: TIGR03087 family PEP-CTERM/XrtA system glycosyltransferase [Pseudomonadota bacterium]|nr:TIGR03087 family PEP-CTERM/XrtA system glycosyltransferase [Pseudomonadota bacterium]